MSSSSSSKSHITSRLAGTRIGILLWLLLHFLMILPGFFAGIPEIDTSFFSILPAASEDPVLAENEAVISARLNNRIRVLVGHPDFQEARKRAGSISSELDGIEGIKDVVWETSETAYDEIRSLVHDNRYQLLGDRDRKLLAEGNGEQIASDALAQVFSPMFFARLDRLDEDPFLLADRIMFNYLDAAEGIGGNFATRDGVLVAEYEGWHYVQVNLLLDSQFKPEPLVADLNRVLDAAVAGQPDWDIVLSGFPLHNVDSSRRASREIAFISSLCLSVLIIILILAFRSARPVLVSVGMIAVAAVSAFSMAQLVFGTVHLFTLVFGTSLIGITIDYALHYFVFRGNLNGPGSKIVARILPGIGLGMLTTVISYIALAVTPIPLLRQISVFSIVGLLSAFLSVVIVFPVAGGRQMAEREILKVRGTQFFESLGCRLDALNRSSRIRLGASVAVVLAVLGSGLFSIELNNDVTSFYTMSDMLAENEYKASLIGGGNSLSRYFIVLGDSPQDVLVNENALAEKLDLLTENGSLGNWLGLSSFLPAAEVQLESWRLAAENLAPLIAAQYRSLGYPPDFAESWQEELLAAGDRIVTPEDILEVDSLSSLGELWIGAAGDRYASVVMVNEYDDPGILAELAGDDIYWNDSVKDISATLQHNSRQALVLVSAAYLLIFLILLLMEGAGRALRISFVPVAAGLMSAGMIGWLGAPFNLFAVFGLILSLGIGIDYSIFMVKGSHARGGTMLAIALSFLSTVLAFGALSLSSFAPVADFGRAVFWGVLFSFLLSPLAALKVETGEI